MRKIVGFLFALVILCQPITASANSLSYIPTYEIEGIPYQIRDYAELIGFELNICPELLEAIAWHESRCTADATNGNCKGLMQVNTILHKERFIEAGWSTADWDDCYINMYVAAQYLKELFDEYEDVGVVLSVYHGEQNAVQKAQSGVLSTYVTEILELSERLERAHGK